MGLLDILKRDNEVAGQEPDAWSWRALDTAPLTPEQKVRQLEGQNARLQEQLWSGGVSYDPDMYLPASGGGSLFFNKLSQSTRELNPIQQQRAIELAYLLYESNPLGKAIVETVRDFVLGNSPKVSSGDPNESRRNEQQQIIEQFWNDYINLMPIKLPKKILELGLFGEQIYTVEVNEKDGHVRLGYIDPAAVQKVLVDPLNVERQLAVITYIRDVGGTPDEKWYKIISPNEDPNNAWYGRLQAMEGIVPGYPTSETSLDTGDDSRTDPVGNGSLSTPSGGAVRRNTSTPNVVEWRNSKGELESHPVDGSCFFFTVNSVSNTTRGRTDLLSLVDWIDAFDQLLFNEMDRGLFLKAFIWDVALQGYTDNQIEAYKKNNPQPRPGAVRYHNEKVTWKAETPSLNAADSSALADLILSYIATGARLPKTWLNGMMDVNKATAQELGTPALARLSLRQEYVKYIVRQIITLVLDQAEMHGIISKRKVKRGQLRPDPWSINIALPDLQQVNQMAVAQAINNIVVGLGLAVQQGMIDVEVAREVVVMFIEQMGVHVDMPSLLDRIKQNPPEPAPQPIRPGGQGLSRAQQKSGRSVISLDKGQNLPTPDTKQPGTRVMQSEPNSQVSDILAAIEEALNERDGILPTAEKN